jgi:hypothetical protein
MAMHDESGSPEAHPLFPASEDDEDDDIKLVSYISISRIENGKQYVAPRQRRADELTSLDQLHAEFGGGEYVLTAFHNGRISTRRKLNLPGKPKPMFDEGINSAEEQRAVSANAPTIDPMAAMGGQNGLMGLIMMMMQQMMQQQAQAAASQTQMFIAMMQGNAQSSAEEKAQARAELQANIERERISSERTMALMREMMLAKGGGSGEDFTRGVEFMRSFATQQIETLKETAHKGGDTDWGSILETFGQVMQGVGMLKQVNGGGSLPEGVPGVPGSAEVAQ